jgi:hypothetical protein
MNIEQLYPMPEFTKWYLFKYKSRLYTFFVAGIIFSGVLLTVLEAPQKIIAIVTFTALSMIAFIGVLHTIAWIKIRRVEKQRISYLLTYYNAVERLSKHK